ncbi:MAG: glycosyltransferase [Bacteroidota bacterium]
MTFTIVTHVPHVFKDQSYYAYGPYVREMNIWAKYVDKMVIVAPLKKQELTQIDLPYDHDQIEVIRIPEISLTSFMEVVKALLFTPFILFQIFRGMLKAHHIHLRCPGNIGLLGAVVQILFPKKSKTAKYAGNWDPMAVQPRSYRIQKKLLANTFWTKNMQVLVYGDWPQQTRNIKSFFTATYPRTKVRGIQSRDSSPPYKFLFVGSLSPGKRPMYCLKLLKGLREKGIETTLRLFGEGTERTNLASYIKANTMEDRVQLCGNQTAETVEQAFKESDFLLLPSKSEGWPKVVAEAMFWGCIPMVTSISCVPWMLGNEERGILLDHELENDIDKIATAVGDKEKLKEMSVRAQKWSHQYTLDQFEVEIATLLK